MREPLRSLFGKRSVHDSLSDPFNDYWVNRMRENLAQLLLPAHRNPSSANSAPVHLLQLEKFRRPARAQGASLVTHAVVFAAVLFLLAQPPVPKVPPSGEGPTVLTGPPLGALRNLLGPRPSDGRGKGGNNEPLPARNGQLPPYSRIELIKPSLPQSRDSQMPIPPTLFDPNAPPILAPTPDIGLPWMRDDTNSGGPGKGHTFGSVGGTDMGDQGEGPAGRGTDIAKYGPGFISPVCSYCPYPTYSDDARNAKVQGTVTLQVLVGADGRAQEIRVINGIGFGLDERAIETVRAWKFIPARDAAKRAVPSWVTVEAVFRLF